MSIDDVARFWDARAATFDDEPDHGLSDRIVRAAWRVLLSEVLPAPPTDIADLGCGTGSLSVLLAEVGHRVVGVDASSEMIAAAQRKAVRTPSATFRRGDVSDPDVAPGSLDAVLVRHVTWALPDPAQAIRHWATLLRDGGVLVMVEGLWSTGAGMTQQILGEHVRAAVSSFEVRRLTDERLWGGPIDDERYMVVGRP